MAKKYDVVATVGTYQKDGEKKYLNKNIGAVIETKNGLSIQIDAHFNLAALPMTEDGKVWLKLFEPKDDKPQAQSAPQQASPQSRPQQTVQLTKDAPQYGEGPASDNMWNEEDSCPF